MLSEVGLEDDESSASSRGGGGRFKQDALDAGRPWPAPPVMKEVKADVKGAFLL